MPVKEYSNACWNLNTISAKMKKIRAYGEEKAAQANQPNLKGKEKQGEENRNLRMKTRASCFKMRER